MKRIRSKLTYANVISTLCLFLVLGTGAAFGAKKLLDGSKIKPHSITAKQIKNKSLTAALFKGSLPSGSTGATGATGPAGSAAASAGTAGPLAYARVGTGLGGLPFIPAAGTSFKNVSIETTDTAVGIACLNVTGSTAPVNIVASEDPVAGVDESDTLTATVDTGYTHAICPAGADAVVETTREGAAKTLPFYVLFN